MTGLTSPPYTDEDARTAVDGSNVAVEEANQANVADVASNADNADQLGGQSPSHFETPNATQNGGVSGGFIQQLSDSGTLYDYDTEKLNFYFSTEIIDAIRWDGTFEGTDTGASAVFAGGNEYGTSGKSGTRNFGAVEASSGALEIDNPYSSPQDYSVTVEIHVVPSGYHQHPI
ncbi:hypothetical protein [Halorubrum salinum]|uniref:hypothetical protein n=1 Tax=Halorubrum salinum TaxID=767517 RepID=UPI0021131D68|nr:hypothetical protein [Halorubrum salinum]